VWTCSDSSQLPGSPNDGDWGRGLPPSTDPRFIGPPGADNSFLYYMARAGVTDGDGQQALIQVAHEICSDLAHGTTYTQEEANLAAQAPSLGRDKAILFVEDAHAFYCPTE
jgi:hypothetical protein